MPTAKMSLFIDHDLQATLTRILKTPLALSKSHPNRRYLILTIVDDEIRVSDDNFTETHRIMSSTTEIVAPATPSTVFSLRHDSPQSISAASTKGDETTTQVTFDTKFEVEKARAKLEIAIKEDEINTLFKALEEKLAVVKGLENEVDEEAKALGAKLEELNKEYDTMVKGLRDAEGVKQNYVMACKMGGNSDADKVNLRKAELEIMKMKLTIAEKEIEVMEVNMAIKEHLASKEGENATLVAAQYEVETFKHKLSDLDKELASAKAAFDQKYSASSGADSTLGTSKDTIVDASEIQALKEKIEELRPLASVGHSIRSRNMEFLNNKVKPGYRINQTIAKDGTVCYKFANSVADSVMYMPFCSTPRASDEFETHYGVPASVVWDHRDFSIFTNMITWKLDMALLSRVYKGDVFNAAYEKLFGKIYPDFELACDADVEKDPELLQAYRTLEEERENAFVTETSYRRTNNRS